MCDYPFFIPQVVLFANSSLFWFKVTNEHREFRNYLSDKNRIARDNEKVNEKSSLKEQKVFDKVRLRNYNVLVRNKKGGKNMSEKEKKTMEEISKAVSGMTEAEKNRFLGIAEGMSIMKDMNQKKSPDKKLET